jgi:hypothetical protein
MRRIALFAIAAGFFTPLLATAPASAQATGTWVSGVGDDLNPCSRTAPCKTFAGAISKTAINGEIRCLDPGGFGALTITKSITVDCHEIPAFSLHSSTTCFTINLTTTLAQDPLQTVRLRNITCNGTFNGLRAGTRGVNIVKASAVFLEDMTFSGSVNQGIFDQRSVTGTLYIKNSNIRDNTGAGITIAPTGGAIVAAVIDNSHVNLNAQGIAVASGNKVTISRSVLTGNTVSGVRGDNGSLVAVDNSVISSNITGVDAAAGSTVRLSNNEVAFNGTGITGATTSFGNNRIFPTPGTAPTPAGADSHDKGQQ